ncbi:MAG: response regulator [Bryobacterales bacterium]|nr:response regulator [Bryobacterales bacterium]
MPQLRIGSNEQSPLAYRASGGAPAGFFVAALTEAGRRAGYDVRWVFRTDSVTQALSSGDIDLWAAATSTLERRKVLHFTAPWWSDPFYIVVAAASGIQDQRALAGRTLTIHRGPPLSMPAETVFPNVKLIYQAFSEDALRSVCSGQADAVLLTRLHLRELLLRRPAGCDAALRTIPHSLDSLHLAIAASFTNRKMAESLREQIGSMARDGSLARIVAQFPGAERSIAEDAYVAPTSQFTAVLVALLLSCSAAALIYAARQRRARLQAVAAAEHASRAKEQFLATVSHEIRTPMNAVLGYLDLLEDTPLTTEQKHLAGDISRGTSSLLTLISNILDFSRIRSGTLELAGERVDLVSLLQDVASSTVLIAEAKDLELAVYLDPTAPRWVRGDTGRLRQILLNLTANAVKFTTAGCVKLDAGFKNGDFVVVIRDTGAGIPNDKLQEIFEPFAQVDSTDTRSHGGVGLGLAIVRDLVRMMHGVIEVDSRVGIGSQFTVRLPLLPDSPEGWIAQDSVGRGLLAVLLVRESANAAILREYLRFCGAETHVFRDEEEVNAWLRKNGATSQKELLLFADPRLLAIPELFARDVRTMGWNHARRLYLAGPISVMRFLTHRSREPFHGTVEWPISVTELLEILVPAHPAAKAHTPQLPMLSGPVLVVDDNPINRKVASALLRKLGCHVDVADDGQAAVEMCRRTAYSLVLMDCQMPVMDGYAAANLICSHSSPAGKPRIIGVSASTEPETRSRCLESGMDGYLPKPLTAAALRTLFDSIEEPNSKP